MSEITIPASNGAKAAFEAAKASWAAAMLTVEPPNLRCNLNVHQIMTIPAVEADMNRASREARAKLMLKPNQSVHMGLTMFNGQIAYRASVR